MPLRYHIGVLAKANFKSFSWQQDLLWGLGLEIMRVIFQWITHLLDRPWLETVSYVVPVFVVLIGDVCIRVTKMAAQLYKERRQDSFRDAMHFATAMLFQCVLLGGLVGYINYLSSPHFTLVIGKRMWIASSIVSPGQVAISQVIELPHPNTAVTFSRVILSNSGVPSVATNWRLLVEFPGKQYVFGEPSSHDVGFMNPDNSGREWYSYSSGEYIFTKSKTRPVDKYSPIDGVAEFWLIGVSENIVGEPGTKLTITCQDSTG